MLDFVRTQKNCKNLPANVQRLKRHGAAALQDLEEEAACDASRKRLGVRQPYAAFVAPGHTQRCVTDHMWLDFESLVFPYVGGYTAH